MPMLRTILRVFLGFPISHKFLSIFAILFPETFITKSFFLFPYYTENTHHGILTSTGRPIR